MASTQHIPTFTKYGGLICGRGGATIKQMKARFFLQRAFLQRGEEYTDTLELTGYSKNIEAALNWITGKYPSAFMKEDNILPATNAKEKFYERRRQRKLSRNSTVRSPIIQSKDFPQKAKTPSLPVKFNFDRYL